MDLSIHGRAKFAGQRGFGPADPRQFRRGLR
jgi:hypothetical protein